MKKRILAFLSLAIVLFAGIVPNQTALASDVETCFELPSTFSTNVTISEIESALNTYISENNLDIEAGTPEYIEFLTNLSMTNEYPDIDGTQLRYFRAYASVYLSNASTQSGNIRAVNLLANDGDKTIAEIKQENMELAQALEQHQPIQQRQPREAYAIILAKAGLNRLNIDSSHVRYIVPFSIEEMIPAMGQGALGIETRKDGEIFRLLARLNDEKTALCARAERAFVRRLEGGCQVPIGVHASINGDRMHICAILGLPDGSKSIHDAITCEVKEGEAMAIKLAESFIDRGAKEILERAQNWL